MNRRIRNPVIPGSPTERTGTLPILRRAVREISRRFDGLEAQVLEIFGRIRVYSLNDTAGRVLYGLTPDELAALNGELQAALDYWIATGRQSANSFWWSAFVSEASQLGTAQTAANLTNLSQGYAAARSLAQIVVSEPYRNRVGIAQIKSYEHWVRQGADIKSDLAQVIGSAVADGRNPKEVVTLLQTRLDVSRSKAKAFAQTDITDTLRQARWVESDAARAEFNLNIAELWTSALLPTTRHWHASRHGHTYTTEQVRKFYDQPGNRYNCFLPGTMVRGRFIAGIKSHYKGPTARLVTAAGRELSVTANHPVLTARGMLCAAELRKGDHLVAYGSEVKRSLWVGDLDGELVGARIEDVFRALVDAGHQFAARVSAVDLHGDGAHVDPDVSVVRTDRPLVFALDAEAAQLLDQLKLVLADASAAGGGSLHEFGVGVGASDCGHVGMQGVRGTRLGAHLPHPVALSVAHSAGLAADGVNAPGDDAALDADATTQCKDGFASIVRISPSVSMREVPVDRPFVPSKAPAVHRLHKRSPADAGRLGEVVDSLSGFASFDELVDLVWSEYDGHVFDLQELSGLMLGSNIVASNCHCSQTECLLDADNKPILTDRLKQAMAKELKDWAPEG